MLRYTKQSAFASQGHRGRDRTAEYHVGAAVGGTFGHVTSSTHCAASCRMPVLEGFAVVRSRHVTNWVPWFKRFSVHSCRKPLHPQYLHATVCTIPSHKNSNAVWTGQKPITSVLRRSHAYTTRTLLKPGLSLPHPYRTITYSASLAATSSGNAYSGYGPFYERLADSAPVHLAENVLITLQEASGLPWWANIMCATVAIRTAVTLPLSVYQMYILARLENLQPEIEQLARHLRYEVSVYGKQHGWSDKTARLHFSRNLRRIMSELYVRDNCHPFKASLLIWIQIPMWISISIALRNFSFDKMSGADVLQKPLTEGGALWFPDLTLPDSTWILPVSLGIANLINLEMFALRKINISKFQKILTNVFRVLCVVMVPVSATMPSSMALYWFISSFVGMLHNLLLLSPTFRRMCRIPRSKSDSDNPYKDLLSAFALKYILRK